MRSEFTPVPGGLRETLSRLDGRLSYRQLDYWVRHGWLTLEGDVSGSGYYRTVSPAEEAAVRDLCDELDRIKASTAAMKSGQFFADALARHSDGTA